MLIRIVNMEERQQDDLRFFFPVVFESGQVFSAVIGAFGMSGKRFFIDAGASLIGNHAATVRGKNGMLRQHLLT